MVLGAVVVGLFAVVALDALGVTVVDLCASVVGMFSGVAIGFDGSCHRFSGVARIDFGAFSTHVVGRIEDLQLLQNFLRTGIVNRSPKLVSKR